ncbi:hypothetical protein [Mycoplasmopsis edwardii]|uniref:hypothetical protein n=1 Tax=Mycoplasmopsis edwardii TaxID=53558 RepID=UPI0011AB31B7|nr:hypothetical protein [Mycoplasmopsis edwardii]
MIWSKDLNKNNFLFFDTLELILKCNDLSIGEELIRELLNIHDKKIDINGRILMDKIIHIIY